MWFTGVSKYRHQFKASEIRDRLPRELIYSTLIHHSELLHYMYHKSYKFQNRIKITFSLISFFHDISKHFYKFYAKSSLLFQVCIVQISSNQGLFSLIDRFYYIFLFIENISITRVVIFFKLYETMQIKFATVKIISMTIITVATQSPFY